MMVVFYFIEEEIENTKEKAMKRMGRQRVKDTSVHLPTFATPRVGEFSMGNIANHKYSPS